MGGERENEKERETMCDINVLRLFFKTGGQLTMATTATWPLQNWGPEEKRKRLRACMGY